MSASAGLWRVSDMERRSIAIVGGGCSGALAALNLLRRGTPVQVHLIEPRGTVGVGLAYSTGCPHHLLNVPAGGMSIFPDAPNDFVDWLGHGANRDDFAPRAMFGRYVADRLEAACRQARVLVRHRTEALDIERQGLRAIVHLNGGRRVEADFVVLALGNFARSLPLFEPAWKSGALDVPYRDSAVAMAGSGLTAVDAYVALRANGHRGVVHMISPRGLLPEAHVRSKCTGLAISWKAARLRTLVREVREQSEQGDWRDVIASLRGATNELWGRLSPADRARFFRHVKPYWDVHRHRMAPEVARMIADGRQNGSLQVHAGRVQEVVRARNGLEIDVRLRSQSSLQLCVQRAINCTGSEHDYRRVESPLLRSLFQKGWLTPGTLGFGVRTNEDGAILDWLYALGPMRIGGLLETTAVPEIRVQAARLAATLSADRTAAAA